MRFFRVELPIDHTDKEQIDISPDMVERRQYSMKYGENIANLCERYNDKYLDKGSLFVSDASYDHCVLGLILRERVDVKGFVDRFFRGIKLSSANIDIKETTLRELEKLLDAGCRNALIHDQYYLTREYDLGYLTENRWKRHYYEEMIARERSKGGIYLAAKECFTKETLIPELDRIYAGTPKRKAYGHPVDYMIESDDEATQNRVTQLLIQSLINVGRIDNRRYSVVELRADRELDTWLLGHLFRLSCGGTIVLNFCKMVSEDSDRADGSMYSLEEVCKFIKRYCCDVLTIIQLPRECTYFRTKIFENVGDCTFVEIKETMAFDEAAAAYLKRRAKEYSIRADKALLSRVEKGQGYLVPDLNAIFDEWYSVKLKTSVYSQYKDISSAKNEVKGIKPRGNAYDELESMIGLSSAKEMIHRALDSYKARKLFKDKGLSDDAICNHMIFTGNPGTAKTTVARLFARILKDNDVLSRGHIIEVGRADLVGRYVGWTAPLVKKKFEEALGGILFIDEAYSLVDDRDGLYGDEAINTIVQEMENHRDELIVIFAGYPDKMEGFLDKNPGLRSRIAHYINFEDYDTDELCLIADHIASQKGMVIDDGAMEKIREIMDDARSQPDFGNGRYVRNVIEKARMAQSSRLVHMDYDLVSKDDVKTILAEDIDISRHTTGNKVVGRIGFTA